MITINEVCGDPLEVNTVYAMDHISADESSEEEVPWPRRSARCKRPAPDCHLNDHEITGRWSEIERQNQQTAVSDEPTGIHRSKRQQIACCICRQNSQRLCEFSNCPQLDKKQVVNRRKKWKVTMKLCELNSFHSHKERNKKWQAKWPTSKFENGMNVSCVWSTRSMEKRKCWECNL